MSSTKKTANADFVVEEDDQVAKIRADVDRMMGVDSDYVKETNSSTASESIKANVNLINLDNSDSDSDDSCDESSDSSDDFNSPILQKSSNEASHCREISIFCMTWNSESVLIAETLRKSGQEPVSFTSERWLGCHQPDFLPQLLNRHILINGQAPHHLLVFALQESAKPGDYFLSDALGKELGERYTLVQREKMIGVGRTTIKALRDECAFRLRGLRLAIFARSDFAQHVRCQASMSVPSTLQDTITQGKGGCGIVLRIQNFGLCAFLNVHLPFTSKTLTDDNNDRLLTGVREQNTAFRQTLKQFLAGRALHHLFVLGDFNYRVMHFRGVVDAEGLCRNMSQSVEFRERVYRECDELHHAIVHKDLPLAFCEGVNNQGPQFMPTAKMEHGRVPGSTLPQAYNLGKKNLRNASWCDRILYLPGSLQRSRTIGQILEEADQGGVESAADDVQYEPARCTLYDRFESGHTMTLSDHAAVVANYILCARR